MKKILFLAAILIGLTAGVQAQKLSELLAKKKQEATEKANAKADQKSSEGIDKAINAPETIIAKKKEKKKEKKAKEEAEKAAAETKAVADQQAATAAADIEEAVIQTNALCNAAKDKLEAALSQLQGVEQARVNVAGGGLQLRYHRKSISYITVLQAINKQGFIADGAKPPAGSPPNPCKSKKA